MIVFAEADVRLHRLTTMRGVAEADARARIAAQATDEQRRAVADVWLDNSGAPEELAASAARVWDERLVPLELNVRERRVAESVPGLVAAEPNPNGPSARLVNRLWALAGELATAVDIVDPAAVELRVTARDAGAAEGLADRLADGGFAPAGPDQYGSCDPGRPATVRVVTR